MGKAKKDRSRKRQEKRYDPAGPTVAVAAPSTSSAPILTKLDAADGEEREAACQAVARLCLEGPDSLTALLQAGCIDRLASRLFDPERPVRVAASGALRNLCLAGGHAVCDRLVAGDITNSLLLIGKQYVEESQGSSEQIPERLEMISQVFELLWHLCESSADATNAFSRQSEIHNLAVQILTSDAFPASLRATVGHFLAVVSDGNPSLCEGPIGQQSPQIAALATNPATDPLLSALALCVLCNLWSDKDPVATAAQALPVMGRVLAAVPTPPLPDVLAALEVESRKSGETEQGDVGFQQPEQVTMWQSVLIAQRVVLELLSNFLADSAEEEEEEGEGDVDMEEDIADATPMQSTSHNVAPHQQELMQALLPALDMAHSPDETLYMRAGQLPTQLRDMLAPLTTLQTRAAETLTNALSLAGPVSVSGIMGVQPQSLWDGVWSVLARAQSLFQHSLVGACVALLWTLLKSDPSLRVVVSSAQSQLLSQLASSSPEVETRVACAGLLGSVGACPYQHELHKGLGEILFAILESESTPSVLAEALNSVFDVYAEPEYNQAFTELHMMDRLSLISNALPGKIKAAKLKREDHAHAKMACVNLKRFLEYKREQF